ncbi:MAG: cellulase family glycosylhydrolase [Chitinispirillaceae bacterium]|nr:cellulase family glycosylhydrolase [Chitinispirillaceae bacterium]
MFIQEIKIAISPERTKFLSATSAIVAAFVLIAALEVRGQAISISGTVKNRLTNRAVQGARVSFEGDTLAAITDAKGSFSLGQSVGVIARHHMNSSTRVYSTPRGIVFDVPFNASVSLSVLSFDGKLSFSVRKSGLNRGQWLVSPSLAPGMYVCKAQVNNTASVFKYFVKGARSASLQMNGDPVEVAFPNLATAAAAPRILVVSKTGFVTKRDTLTSPAATEVTIRIDSANSLPHEPAINFTGFNWADSRDNYVTGILYISGLSATTTYAQAQVLTEMVCRTWDSVGANLIRLPINVSTVASSFWSVYKGVFDKATSMGFKVMLCPWTENHSQKIENLDKFYAMWSKVTNEYKGNPLVYFELMNEMSGYTPAAWATICDNWFKACPTISKRRVIIPGCGKHGERWGNEMGKFPQFDSCLLATHLYNPWDGTENDTMVWYNRAKEQIAPYGNRMLVTEYGQSMASTNNYMGGPNYNAVTAYMAGLTRYMKDNKMGGTSWPGLRDNDPWGFYKRNGTTSMTVTNASGLARVRYSWGL